MNCSGREASNGKPLRTRLGRRRTIEPTSASLKACQKEALSAFELKKVQRTTNLDPLEKIKHTGSANHLNFIQERLCDGSKRTRRPARKGNIWVSRIVKILTWKGNLIKVSIMEVARHIVNVCRPFLLRGVGSDVKHIAMSGGLDRSIQKQILR